jgi:pyruvate kinase
MVETIRTQLSKLRDDVVKGEHLYESELSLVHEVHRERARNLVHFLTWRECHVNGIEASLEALGLDPLRDLEWDVLPRVERVLERLNEMSDVAGDNPGPSAFVKPLNGRDAMRLRTDALFGPPPEGRDSRIMVTLPSEAADDPYIIKAFVDEGADCFRINCARDGRDVWEKMIERISREREGGKRASVFLDLGGSKLRVVACTGGKRSIRLEQGDTLRIRRSPSPAFSSEDAGWLEIAVSEPVGLRNASAGHHIWFDDGKIGGIVRKTDANAIEIEITSVKKGGRKLRLERGLNLPDTPLHLQSMTQKDYADLPFASGHADFVALSFIRTPSDVDEFRMALPDGIEASPTLVIKIETWEALQQLPRLMLAGMRRERVAMLLARGDLAVECGITALPRIQNDVLRYCAAGSLPLFWATGVLERASRTGEPTRSEMTDAAYASRAQCVMLNKGPRNIQALRLLGNLLERRNGAL